MSAAASFDVVVVGAGAVGSAIASALTRQGASVALVEARSDVGAGTSKANTAIWHTGFDAKPGTLESRLSRAATDSSSSARRSSGGPSSAPAPSSSPGTTISWRASTRSSTTPSPTATPAHGHSRPTRSTPAIPTSAPERAAA